jgi:Peptidase S8 pro-domain
VDRESCRYFVDALSFIVALQLRSGVTRTNQTKKNKNKKTNLKMKVAAFLLLLLIVAVSAAADVSDKSGDVPYPDEAPPLYMVSARVKNSKQNPLSARSDVRMSEVAKKHGFVNTGRVGTTGMFYLFRADPSRAAAAAEADERTKLLTLEPEIRSVRPVKHSAHRPAKSADAKQNRQRKRQELRDWVNKT